MVINSGKYTANGDFTAQNLTLNGGNLTSGSSCDLVISSYLLLNNGDLNLSVVNSYSVNNADINGGVLTCDGGNASSLVPVILL